MTTNATDVTDCRGGQVDLFSFLILRYQTNCRNTLCVTKIFIAEIVFLSQPVSCRVKLSANSKLIQVSWVEETPCSLTWSFCSCKVTSVRRTKCWIQRGHMGSDVEERYLSFICFTRCHSWIWIRLCQPLFNSRALWVQEDHQLKFTTWPRLIFNLRMNEIFFKYLTSSLN